MKPKAFADSLNQSVACVSRDNDDPPDWAQEHSLMDRQAQTPISRAMYKRRSDCMPPWPSLDVHHNPPNPSDLTQFHHIPNGSNQEGHRRTQEEGLSLQLIHERCPCQGQEGEPQHYPQGSLHQGCQAVEDVAGEPQAREVRGPQGLLFTMGEFNAHACR